jgi:hypothetical protein
VSHHAGPERLHIQLPSQSCVVVRRPRPDPKQVAAEWGLPDWHNPQQYPDHRIVGVGRFAWEFARRSGQYRTFWCDKVVPLQRRHAALPQLVERMVAGQMGEAEAHAFQLEILELPPDEAAPLIERLHGGQTPVGPMPEEALSGGRTRFAVAEAMRQFGLFYAIDPRESGEGQVPLFIDRVPELHAGIVYQDPRRVTVELDTRLSVTQQLERVKSVLDGRQRMLEFQSRSEQQQREIFQDLMAGGAQLPKPRALGARARVEHFANYLRVLDAKEMGATNLEIAEVLFPRLAAADGVTQIKNHFNAARELRDGGYRRLC